MMNKKAHWVTSAFDDDDDFTASLTPPPPPPPPPSSAKRSFAQSNIGRSVSADAGSGGYKQKKSVKRSSDGTQQKKCSQSKAPTPPWDELWSGIAVTRDKLAVHKKKVQEVEDWLLRALTGVKGYRLLLLTGPAGSGKTACVQALAAEMSLTVQEWINPATNTAPYEDDRAADESGRAAWIPGDSVPELSQLARFREFVLRVNKYGIVATTTTTTTTTRIATTAGGRNLLLVEDFPNAFYRDPTQFHDVLRRFAVTGGCTPAVFIVSDSQQQQHSAKHILPTALHPGMSLTHIQFNPVAAGLLTKALQQTCRDRGCTTPPDDVLANVAAAAAGDVRTAVNTLHFVLQASGAGTADVSSSVLAAKSIYMGCSSGGWECDKAAARGSRNKKASKPGVGRGGGDGGGGTGEHGSLAPVGGKDASLLIFRALGKVLYCKRGEGECVERLPSHLYHHTRRPLVESAEAILDKSGLTPATFLAFLHQNYTHFTTDIPATLAAVQYLADADFLTTAEWAGKETMSAYCTVGVRGLMHAVSSVPGVSGVTTKRSWRPLTGPVYAEVRRTAESRIERLRTAYRQEDMHALTTTLVPYAASVFRNVFSENGQLLQEVGRFSSHGRYLQSAGERLTEGDTVDCSGDAGGADVGCNGAKFLVETEGDNLTKQESREEEFEDEFAIEEFED